MSARFIIESPCEQKKTFCVNCHSEFTKIRPLIKEVIVTKHFVRDLKDKEEADSIVKGILDCSNLEFSELHKFEENIYGNLIFRAKKGNVHFVYFVDKKRRIIFLRAFDNFTEYKKFLDDRKSIRRILEETVNLA
jgi:mRNA-degrading endonuclease RelE of RelBE toxin-antitoxin system